MNVTNRSGIAIRLATAADIEATSALLVRAWHATYDAIYGVVKVNEITARWHTPATLLQQLGQADAAFLIAELDGSVVATSYAHMIAERVLSLDRIYVAPDALGRGIGTKLLVATLATFPTARRVRLEVASQNARAIAFYRRNGFAKSGSVASCGSDSGVAADIYQKLL